MGRALTSAQIADYGQPETYSSMIGCSGKTYTERKVDLLHQLGFYNVTTETFANCKSEIEIDRRARNIIFN